MDLTHLYKKELWEKIKKDTNEMQVKDIADIFAGTLLGLLQNAECFNIVKNKVTEQDFNNMINSLTDSFIVSLYCFAAKNDRELKKRVKLALRTGCDEIQRPDDMEDVE